jgi:hypothetical protein
MAGVLAFILRCCGILAFNRDELQKVKDDAAYQRKMKAGTTVEAQSGWSCAAPPPLFFVEGLELGA